MASVGIKPTIVTNPPTEPAAPSNPRRMPAHRSVSLLHTERHKPAHTARHSSSSSDSGLVTARKRHTSHSPSSLQPQSGKTSSGNSSNAEKWFEKSNNEVRNTGASYQDNDPPFYMRNSSSSETPPDATYQLQNYLAANDGSNSLPLRTGLLNINTDGSSTEEFHSIIDDLTVENKKLKRRLKKYEKLHDSHLKDEKLFEVRIHGLPTEKKHELEETLRKFASNLASNNTNPFPPNGYASLLPLLNSNKTASSQTSIQNTDSAYASMSGQGSSALSGSGRNKVPSRSALASKRQNIHSYLHHIPEGLLPQQSPTAMSDHSKKKLVVRRMEQIFAGKGAAAEGHQQPLQQQLVSQDAARADRTAIEATGQSLRQEGNREAHIMDKETEDPLDLSTVKGLSHATTQPTVPSQLSKNAIAEQDYAIDETTAAEQRPTRPLDLDPSRAQVPADNFRYMRHLGFSPNDMENGRSPEAGHGWIYLNFLINMAQLHTINVTVEFVRKAITEYSEKFEVSEDGRKVRWRGGKRSTRTSSNSGGSSNDRTNTNTPDGQSPRKRPKLSHTNSASTQISQLPNGATSRWESNRYQYTPLFFHRDSADSEDSSSEENDESVSSPFRQGLAGDSSGMTSSGIRTSSGLQTVVGKQKKKGEDGPIIFYNNARFCTDLSGESRPAANDNAPVYYTATASPIGKAHKPSKVFETKGPLAVATELPEPMDLSDNPIPESMELSFPEKSPLKSSSTSPSNEPINLDVTGIGGVCPADNFAISVKSLHARTDQEEVSVVGTELSAKSLPPKFAELLRKADFKPKVKAAVHEIITSSEPQQLPPSKLPEAIGFMPFEESYEDEDSEDDEISVAPESPGAFPPSTAPQPVGIPYASSDEEDDEDEDEESDSGESDGSLDFLATAREFDPEAIRQREREYDANMAERLAEDIPAGSSAATAGGGSGFASPASGITRDDYRRAMQDARARPVGLNRARTGDSMLVQTPRSASSEVDEDEDEEMDDVKS